MGRYQELVSERDRLRREIESLQARIRDLRVRQATLDCALEFAADDETPALSAPTLTLKKAA